MINKKRTFVIVSLILAMLMLMSSVSVFAESSAVPVETVNIDDQITEITEGETGEQITYNAGDINGDGAVDINDATDYQLTLVGRKDVTPYFEKNGDTNIDQKKNIYDVTVIQYRVAGIYKKLPVTADGYYAEIIQT